METKEIQFEFIENDSIGLNKEQIAYIKNLIMYYVDKYPLVELNIVCDYFSWDYMERC